MLKVVLFVCLYFIIGIMCWLSSLKIEYDDYDGSIENFIYLHNEDIIFNLFICVFLWPIIMVMYIVIVGVPYIAEKFLSAINK